MSTLYRLKYSQNRMMPILARRNEYDEDDNGKDDKEAEERLQEEGGEGEEEQEEEEQEEEDEEEEIRLKINYRWRRNIVLQIHYHQW